MIDIGRRPRKCRICKSFEHDMRKCPERVKPSEPEAPIPQDHIASVAQLRERRDALVAELADYERVKVVVDERLANNRAEVIAIDREIARLRTVS